MNEILKLNKTAFAITLRCPLHCKLCSVYAPYYKKPPHFNLYQLTEMIDKYFSVVDFVERFSPTGGEPLLHKHLPDIIEYLLKYKDRIGEIAIFTSGTVIPSEQVIKMCQKNPKTYFLVDDYGSSLSTQIPNIEKSLSEGGVRYMIRKHHGSDTHFGGWVYFGDAKRQIWFTQSEIEMQFSKCAQSGKGFCFFMIDGKLYPCTYIRRCIELGTISKDSKEYLDLCDNSLTIEEKKSRLRNIKNTKSLTACAYCTGMCEDSKRFPPAEQLFNDKHI